MEIFTLKHDEQVLRETTVSRSALLVSWLSVPCYVFAVYFPLIKWGFLKLLWKLCPELTMILSTLFGLIIIILSLIWIGVCISQKKNKNGKLILTDQRILGKQDNHILAENLSDIVDVRLEQSLWGKLFNFGSITILTNGQNLTIKDLHQAAPIRQQILNVTNIRYY